MQAAHPLVIAGARETGFYERNPWKRLERTLMLTYAITFGTRAEAERAATRINDVHARIHGTDPVTGKHYDALDPELLLWVHACLEESALLYEHFTVGRLGAAGRQRFHEEQMTAAEMLMIPREMIPPTVSELRRYVRGVVDGGDLLITDAARSVENIFRHPPPEAEWKPVLRAVAWWAFGTLPPRLREMYGVSWNGAKQAGLQANFEFVKLTRPLLPPKLRFIMPYGDGLARLRGEGAGKNRDDLDEDGGEAGTRAREPREKAS
jgi:uncharacterized protein (DUF2236 family)